jgi:energy coupling factor transporter S component ThiW
VGEVIGTGLLGSLVSVWIVGPLLMGKTMALVTLVVAFSVSTLGGTIIALIALHFLRKAGFWGP